MSKSLRLSDALFKDAEASAQLFHRSPPQQIEHWAKIGQVMEAALSYPAQASVKATSMADIDQAMAYADTPAGKATAQAFIEKTSGKLSSRD
jgi:predicted nucleotidyltransferase